MSCLHDMVADGNSCTHESSCDGLQFVMVYISSVIGAARDLGELRRLLEGKTYSAR